MGLNLMMLTGDFCHNGDRHGLILASQSSLQCRRAVLNIYCIFRLQYSSLHQLYLYLGRYDLASHAAFLSGDLSMGIAIIVIVVIFVCMSFWGPKVIALA